MRAGLQAGAAAYLAKTADREEILRAVTAAASAGNAPHALAGGDDLVVSPRGGWIPRLTLREHQALMLAHRGLDKPQMATTLGIDEAALRQALSGAVASSAPTPSRKRSKPPGRRACCADAAMAGSTIPNGRSHEARRDHRAGDVVQRAGLPPRAPSRSSGTRRRLRGRGALRPGSAARGARAHGSGSATAVRRGWRPRSSSCRSQARYGCCAGRPAAEVRRRLAHHCSPASRRRAS